MRAVAYYVGERDAAAVGGLFRAKHGVRVAAVEFVPLADRRQLQPNDAVYSL